MATKGKDSDRGESRHYRVTCEACSLDEPATGRDEAERIATEHEQLTGHTPVAVEVPPTLASP